MARIADEEMSEWSIERAWKAMTATLTKQHGLVRTRRGSPVLRNY